MVTTVASKCSLYVTKIIEENKPSIRINFMDKKTTVKIIGFRLKLSKTGNNLP